MVRVARKSNTTILTNSDAKGRFLFRKQMELDGQNNQQTLPGRSQKRCFEEAQPIYNYSNYNT